MVMGNVVSFVHYVISKIADFDLRVVNIVKYSNYADVTFVQSPCLGNILLQIQSDMTSVM